MRKINSLQRINFTHPLRSASIEAILRRIIPSIRAAIKIEIYRVTGNAQILEKALFPKLKLTRDLN